MNQYDNVPAELKDRPQWVLWRRVVRDGKATKVPFTAAVNVPAASTIDPTTWATFAEAVRSPAKSDGIGYVFSKDDPYVGIDLDNCRNPETGEIAEWATKIIRDLATYAEVSPSKTGVKLWARGTLPTDQTGKKAKYQTGQVEMYQRGRYFAVTGEMISGTPAIRDCSAALSTLWNAVFGPASSAPTAEKSTTGLVSIREKILALPDAVAGEQGHDKTFRAACEILRYGIDGEDGRALLDDYNAANCDPPWTKAELDHKWKSAHGHVLRGREFGILAPERKGFNFGFIDYHQFQAMDFPQRYLVRNAVVEGEHLIIGGPKKSLKTLLTLDLMVSLASGQPFLGKFEIERQCPVAFVSGESGRATLQRAAKRIAETRGARIPRDSWFIGFDLPQLANDDHMDALAADVERLGIGFLAIDPAYLCTLEGRRADSASNVFAMGPVLAKLGKVGVKTGCTMALVHHARKSNRRESFKPLELDDLTQSGFAEWARQWLLIGRRSNFAGGRHELYLTVGGSAGHSGEWEVDVNEGQPDDPLVGRLWGVECRPLNADDEAPVEVDAAKADEAFAAVLRAGSAGISPYRLRKELHVGADTLDEIVKALTSSAKVGLVDTTVAGKPAKKIFAAESLDFLR